MRSWNDSLKKMTDKLRFAVGLAKKAGQTVTGADLILEKVRKGQPAIVIIASDASAGSRDKLIRACEHHNVRCVVSKLGKDEISGALGLSGYTAAVAVQKHEIVNLIDRALETADPDGQ